MKIQPTKGLHLVILISFRPETPEEVREEMYQRYQNMGEECGGADSGILYWAVRKNRDLRKGVHLVELAIFKDDLSLERFKTHEKHQDLLKTLREVADWQVGNFIHE